MAFTRAEAFAPATVANLGAGFDILGLALQEPGDIVIAEWANAPAGVIVERIEGDGGRLPRDPARNTAAIAASSVLRAVGETRGVRLTIKKGLPLASGMGSSAASAVAGAVAVNALLGEPLSQADLLPACLDGEAAVSGYHADNAAPCLFGGILLISGAAAAEIVRLPVPPNLHLALVTPAVEVPTAEARAVLPKTIPLKTMIAQTAAVARLIHALHMGDLPALAEAMEADSVVEPARAHLMPLLAEMRAEAKRAGALGLVISGAGPTLCAICDDAARAEAAAAAMQAAYRVAGIGAVGRATRVSERGAQVINRD